MKKTKGDKKMHNLITTKGGEDQMGIIYHTLPTLRCNKCGHVWVPRANQLPKICPNPKCKSLNWNEPSEIKNAKQ